ncbi:MAG: protein kinase [Candidatus Zixiibacteriota bacterium]|nr:MAG: protein kinase [candidate division Zixibacteria bacterium]
MLRYAPYILYMLISILMALLFLNGFSPLESLQCCLNDVLCRVTAPDMAGSNVVLVSIDKQAQSEYGDWPWDYDLIADLLAATATGEAKAIMLDFVLSEDAEQDSAGFTDILAEQLSWIDNAVMPYDIALATFRSNKTHNPRHLFDHSVGVDNPLGIMEEESSLQVRKVFLPADKVLASKPMLGYDYTMPDADRILRHESLVMNYDGYYYPSLPLLAAAAYLGVPPDQILVAEKKGIQLGSLRTIPINDKSEVFIRFAQRNGFRRFSAAEVLAEGFDLTRLKNKLVVIDYEDPASNQYFSTPVHDQIPKSVVKASVADNIVNGNFIAVEDDLALMGLLIIFVLGGACAFVMPQVSLAYRLMILGGAMVILANVNYFLFSSFGVLVNTVYFGAQLFLFMLAAPLLDSQLITGVVEESTKKTRRSGIPRVELDAEPTAGEAKTPVREIIESANDPENQETTAITDDQQHYPEDHQAINIDDESDQAVVAAPDSGEVEEQEDITEPSTEQTEESVEEAAIISPDSSLTESDQPADDSANDTGEVSTGGFGTAPQITHLGRYQITGTLGRGAMGHVYRGIDPAINRPVALKTIRLDFVNDPDEMEELKERLFREAQAAGKLSHPNIVTIYDVGSEGHLQYIAMEFLEGSTLDEMIKKKVKFNYKIIAQIIIQICSALEYAHEQGIVHRDIKPANIMVLKDYRVKVMDYGIARIDSNSMTKTGIAMGTPNYISPEQLKGQPVDQRADIFSLGVVFYEMLLGRRPFKGENLTSLIYSTLNHDPMKPSNVNPQIPLLFDHIIDKALRKNPSERYQRAKEMVSDLSEFVESFVS